MKSLRIQEIRSFLAVCKYGSFSKAAENTYTTQPTISWQISSLEKELGVPLFIRGKGFHQVKLTRVGSIFQRQAEKIYQIWGEIENLVEAGASELFVFSCIPSLSGALLPALHARFREEAPDCALELHGGTSREIVAEVEAGTVDCGIVCESLQTVRFQTVPVAQERMVFLCRADAPYDDHVAIAALRRERQLYIPWSPEAKVWEKEHFDLTLLPYAKLLSVRNLGQYFVEPDIWAVVPASVAAAMPAEEFRSCTMDVPPNPRIFYLISKYAASQTYYELALDSIRTGLAELEGIQLIAE